MTKKIKLSEKKALAIIIAALAYYKITKLPKSIRPDDKERTGIQIFVRVPGTRNLIYFPISEPSEAAKVFSIEKAIRSAILNNATSEESADPSIMQYAGSVTICLDGVEYQVSVSGLKAEEDVAVAVIVLSKILNVSTMFICEEIGRAHV